MIRAFQWDLARQVERLDWLLAQLPRYADWGYQELYLHLEDAVDYPRLPGVARSDAYSWTEFERLVEAAGRHGIRVVPIVNLLGHTQYLVKTAEWRDLNELRAPDGSPLERGQICPLHPRTLEVAERLLADIAPFCTAGKVHVGLDESYHLGQHPLSQQEIAEVGLAGHFARYVHRLHRLAQAHRLRLGYWADLLAFIPEAIPQLPAGTIAYDWYYYPFRRHPRVELFNFAEVDLASPLLAQGIEYWGCPMNGSFRFEPLPVFGERLANAQSWWRRCGKVSAGGFLVTSWEPYRLAIEMTTVVDAAIASLWLDPSVDDHLSLLTRGFERVSGRAGARTAARTALVSDAAAFAGYARWELNHRWDATPFNDGVVRYSAESRLFGRLCQRPGLPPPLKFSLTFRHYLAERDTFVRRAVKGIQRLRRLEHAKTAGGHAHQRLVAQLRTESDEFALALEDGRRAARAMWRRSRDATVRSHNETLLVSDAARLAAWQRWLAHCALNAAHVWTASPVAGAWQLQLVVINFAPAVPRVVIEQRQPNGQWTELAGRHTIEFRSAAARPRCNIRRPFVVPLLNAAGTLRLAMRGVGQVRITQVQLTNGVESHRPKGWKPAERRMLGLPPPRKGWPNLSPVKNTAEIELHFPTAAD